MELQEGLPGFEDNGVAVFAISYDPVDVLATFAERRGITYPLLSDEGSHTIRRLGLENQHVAEQQAFYDKPVSERHVGIPYPGVFLLDEQGVITGREFEQSYRVRPSSAWLLEDLTGEAASVATAASAPVRAVGEGPGVHVTAWLDADTFRAQQHLRLHVALRVQPGLHVYRTPIPTGYVPLTLELTAEGLDSAGFTVDPVALPEGRELYLEGLDERFVVLDGSVRADVAFVVVDPADAVSLRLAVSFQACTDTECFPPSTVELRLDLRGVGQIFN